jgi:glycosyltransferase involved in cell wall biosynthesis
MKRVFFLNRYFFPDHSATSQILSQLAFHLAKSGRNTHVITSRQIYDNPNARLPAEEIQHGVTIHRISGTHFGRSGLLTRSIDYLSFYWAAWRKLLELVNPNDILVTMTDPPLLSILGKCVAHRKGVRLVNWLQDIYPEIAAELGVPLIKGPLSRLLAGVRNSSLQAADANVVVGECMAEKVSTFGVPANRIRIIPNWSDDEQITPIDASNNLLRAKWRLEGKFVVGYSGNLGRAHEFDTLLTASEQFRDNPRIVFLFIGSGHRSTELARQVETRGLANRFLFLPYQDTDALKYSLSVPDVHWVSLRPELEGLIVPSKVYGIAAAGRPIIAITAKDGEIARLVETYKCGIIVEPHDAAGLVNAIIRLSNDPKATATMGQQARAMLDSQFTRGHAFERWETLINSIG